MSDALYLRPLGFLYGAAATLAARERHAGFLAGGPVAFSLVEIIEGTPGKSSARIIPFADCAASKDEIMAARLDRLAHPRAPIAGMALDRPHIMGVVNVTPDSFSDGGLYDTSDAAVARGAVLMAQGADILDIGGESTRPGSDAVDAAHEADRILPVIKGLRGVKAVLSADTRKASVMRQAAAMGVGILNDVSALTFDPESLDAAASSGLPVILMHAQGDPKTMQDNPVYADVVLEVYDYLDARIAACEEAGITRDRLIADPGIGFGKTLEHNLALLEKVSLFHGLGVPLLIGVSRKRFIGTLTAQDDPQKRVAGSIGAGLGAVAQGVQMLRVHDVAETAQALTLWQAAMLGTPAMGV